MSGIDQNRFFSMAETYDKIAPLMVPAYDLLQNEALMIASFPTDTPLTFIDLGAGSGILLEKILTLYPRAQCYWIDYSQDFLQIAQQRLARFPERVNFLLAALEENWEEQLPGPVNAIFSMSAIHHLPANEKRRLYQKCFSLLKERGWLVNIDEMDTLNKDAYIQSMHFWIQHVENTQPQIPPELQPFSAQWKIHFEQWKLRNLTNIDQPKSPGDDLHESFLIQLGWLKEIGFQKVDLYLKYHLWSVIGGQK